MHLSYNVLKEGKPYLVGTSLQPIQGAGTMSTASQRTADYVAIIMKHWGLSDPSAILPSNIAPRAPSGIDVLLKAPHLWPYRFTQELRKLSGRTKGRQDHAIALLCAVVEARQLEDPFGVQEASTGGIRKVVKEMGRQKAWGELAEEKEASETFGGEVVGMRDALEEVEQSGGKGKGKGKQVGGIGDLVLGSKKPGSWA